MTTEQQPQQPQQQQQQQPKRRVLLVDVAMRAYAGPFDGEIDDPGFGTYQRDTDLETFARSLAAAEPTDLGEGVEWYELQHGLDHDAAVLSKGLVTRKDSRAITEAVLSKVNEKTRRTMSFIIGSPGIGKTRLLTYFLRQLLQKEDDVNVQYLNQKAGKASLFLRRERTTYAYKSRLLEKHASGSLFEWEPERALTYILLDPKEEGADFSHPEGAHLIVSCSANIKHYHNIKKEGGSYLYYLGLPSTTEVEKMASKLAPELDPKELLERINVVGAVPRYLFCGKDVFEDRMEEISTKAGDTTKKGIDAELVVQALTRGTALSNQPTLCGAFFAHVNQETTDEAGVTSTNYEEQRISLLSQYAAWLLYKRFRRSLVQATLKGEHCDTTTLFEKLSAFDLMGGGNFSIARLQPTRGPVKREVKSFYHASVIRVKPSRRNVDTQKKFIKPALSGDMETIITDFEAGYDVSEADQPPAKKRKGGSAFIVLNKGFPAIDFLNTERQVFQAKTGRDHDMNGWVDLLLQADILSLDNTKKKLKVGKNPKPLEFYWVVPEHLDHSWLGRKRKMPTSDDIPSQYRNEKQKKVIHDAIEKHVHQFVLFIEKEQPRQSEFWSMFNPLQGTAIERDGWCQVM